MATTKPKTIYASDMTVNDGISFAINHAKHSKDITIREALSYLSGALLLNYPETAELIDELMKATK